jgi:hypothetical protein
MWRIGRADPRARTVRQIGGARLERSGKERRSSNGRSRRSGIFREAPAREGGLRIRGREPNGGSSAAFRSPAHKRKPRHEGGVRRKSQTVYPVADGGGTLVHAGDCIFVSAGGREGKSTCRKKHPALRRVSCGRNRQAAQGTRNDPPGFAAQVCRLTAVRLPLRRRREPRSSRPVLGCR